MREKILQSEELGPIQVSSDGRTCWVNTTGVCIGRWSPVGVDVHLNAQEQIETGRQCLDCVENGSWGYFRDAMKKHYDLDIPDDMVEERFRGRS